MDGSRKKQLFAAIGLISVNFQCLEKSMEFFAWALIGEDQEIGQIVTSQISFNRLCDLIGSLFRYRAGGSGLVKELDGLIKRASKVAEERDRVIHSNWAGDLESSILRVKITAKRETGLKHQYEYTDPNDLLKIGGSIEQVWKDLMGFIKKAENEGIITPTSRQIKTPAA